MKQDYWTDDRIGKLDAKGLINLRTNAVAKGTDELVARCEDLLKIKNVRAPGARLGGRPESERNLLTEGDEKLTNLARKLLAIYDLSETAARAASIGVKGYRYISLVGKNGNSKLGGYQRNGDMAIDRYISFQIGREKVALGIMLAKGQPVEQHRWFLSGPKRLLPNQGRSVDVVPGMPASSSNIEEGVVFDDFDAAAQQFKELLAVIAPKRLFLAPDHSTKEI